MALPAVLVSLVLALALPAKAQNVPPSKVAALDPTRADVRANPLPYRSPFDGYRPHRDIAPGPWRAMNDEVARIGGWKAYAREVHEATASKPTADSRAAPAAVAVPPARAP